MATIPNVHQLFEFPAGYAMTSGTVGMLCELAVKRSKHPRMRARVRQIFADAGVPSTDYDGEIEAVYRFIMENIRYQHDPLGVEYVTDPVTLDEQIDEGNAAEDCESLALYAATLLAAAGIRSDFDIQGPKKGSRRYTHCALIAENPHTHEWTSFDPVGEFYFPEAFTLGDSLWKPGMARERWTLEGVKRPGMGDNVSNLNTVEKYGTPVADAASAFGPYGALVGGAFKIGTSIADSKIKPGQPGTVKPKSGPLPPQTRTPGALQLHRETVKSEKVKSLALYVVLAVLGYVAWRAVA